MSRDRSEGIRSKAVRNTHANDETSLKGMHQRAVKHRGRYEGWILVKAKEESRLRVPNPKYWHPQQNEKKDPRLTQGRRTSVFNMAASTSRY